ncbi:NAD-dependent epimerase/dehydratase family protein [Paradesertivirga mongoliensis]|uniref:NAD-dependent epimerase/dehydratase family protein n=1 Tax=Paradesertivirga mongoliensis TaxID=2100740 RepID=A0ABW4ZIL5_9SPHI
MKILITGYNGFVGTNLREYLYSHQIVTVGRGKNVTTLGCTWETLDSCGHIDSIIHLAGKAHDTKGASTEKEYLDVNFGLTKAIFDYFMQSKASKFIFLSSVKAVADVVNTELVEDVVPMPASFYGKSKLLAEQYIGSRSIPSDKLCYVLRPCMIHGPGNKGNLNLLYNLVSKGVPYPLASFSNHRSFLSVENLCFIIKEILERDDILPGTYNVSDDEPLSTTDVVTLLAQAQNRSPRLLHIPKSLISGFARLGDKLHLPLTSERLQKLTEDFVVSNKKIKEAIHKELPLASREGLLKTARSFSEGQ